MSYKLVQIKDEQVFFREKKEFHTLFLCFLSEGGKSQAVTRLGGLRPSEGCLVVAKDFSGLPGEQWKEFPKLSVSLWASNHSMQF